MSVLVFDLDGTLVSSKEDLAAALNAVLTKYGHNAVPEQKVGHLIGMGAKALIQRGLEENNATVEDQELQDYFSDFLDFYEANIAVHTRPFDSVVETLQSLKGKGWKLAVCTNKSERLTHPLLAALDLTQHFDAIVCGDTFSNSKPHPEPVHGAILRSNGTIEGSVMIGDSGTDINAAKNAGIPVIAVDFGYTPVPVTELDPDQVISHFDELEEAISGVV